MVNRVLMLAVMAIMGLVLVGCADLVGGAIEQVTGMRVDEQNGGVTVKGQDGTEITVGGGAMAEELRDFPRPSGFEVDAETLGSMTTKDGRLVSATWRGPMPVDQVMAFYEQELTAAGYEQLFAATSGGSATAQYADEDQGRSVNIVITRDDNTTTIAVVMMIDLSGSQ